MSILGNRAFIERRRTWRERLFTRPWRPFVAWEPHGATGRIENVRIRADGVSVEFRVADIQPAGEDDGAEFPVTIDPKWGGPFPRDVLLDSGQLYDSSGKPYVVDGLNPGIKFEPPQT